MLSYLLDNIKVLLKTFLTNVINPSVRERNQKQQKSYMIQSYMSKKNYWKQSMFRLALQLPMKFKSNYKRTLWPLNKIIHLKVKREIFVIATLKKIYAKCPLLFDFVKNCTILSPLKLTKHTPNTVILLMMTCN